MSWATLLGGVAITAVLGRWLLSDPYAKRRKRDDGDGLDLDLFDGDDGGGDGD